MKVSLSIGELTDIVRLAVEAVLDDDSKPLGKVRVKFRYNKKGELFGADLYLKPEGWWAAATTERNHAAQ